jgi:hypothetical protein
MQHARDRWDRHTHWSETVSEGDYFKKLGIQLNMALNVTGQPVNRTTVVSPFKDKNKSEIHMKIQSVPRSKHSVSVIQTCQLMLYRENVAVCSQIHRKHIYSVWAERGTL